MKGDAEKARKPRKSRPPVNGGLRHKFHILLDSTSRNLLDSITEFERKKDVWRYVSQGEIFRMVIHEAAKQRGIQ